MALRVGVVGCGAISGRHLAAWCRIQDATVVAVCDRVLERADACRHTYARTALVYPTLDALLASQPVDIVDIVTPPSTHLQLCRMAAAAGVHFLVQKPLGDRLEDAGELVNTFTGYPRVCGVHENHRYRPWFRTVCEKARAGAFGTVRSLRLAQHDPYPPPEPFKRESTHGVMLEYGTHLIDMTRALLGEPARIAARLHRVNPGVRGDSLAMITLLFPEATATIEISWKRAGLQQGEALVIGDAAEAWYEGRMTRGESSRFRLVENGEVTVDEVRCPTDDYAESFYLLQREFVDAVQTGKPFTQSLSNNLKTLTATFAAYDAACQDVFVRLA